MNEYEVTVLRRACEELALKCVILSSRLDDLESRFEHTRQMAFNACFEVAKLKGNPEGDPVNPVPPSP